MAYYNIIAQQLGVPIWLLALVVVWDAIWKLIALWKSARNKHYAWFIIMGIVNTIGILPILYIYIFSKLGKPKNSSEKKPIKKKVSRRKR